MTAADVLIETLIDWGVDIVISPTSGLASASKLS
jgi:hypothetical protein